MRRHLTSLLVGILGVALGLTLWHLWLDHKTLHDIITMINASAQKAAESAPQ